MQVLISLRLSRFSESLRDQRALLYLFHFATVRNHVSAFTRGAATAQVRSVTRGGNAMKQVDCWLFTATYLFPDAKLGQLIHPVDVCVCPRPLPQVLPDSKLSNFSQLWESRDRCVSVWARVCVCGHQYWRFAFSLHVLAVWKCCYSSVLFTFVATTLIILPP